MKPENWCNNNFAENIYFILDATTWKYRILFLPRMNGECDNDNIIDRTEIVVRMLHII